MQHAYQTYQGGDWHTCRYSVAQVFDLLDQVRDVTAMLLSVGQPPSALLPQSCHEPMLVLHDLCHDLSGAVDMALADLTVAAQHHLPSRWLMVELRTLVAQLPAMVRQCAEDAELLPSIADRSERVRHLLRRLD